MILAGKSFNNNLRARNNVFCLKHALIFLILVFFNLNGRTQINFDESIDEWRQYPTESADVTIEYAFSVSEVQGQFTTKYLLLRISNVSDKNVQVQYDFSNINAKNECLNCDASFDEWHIVKKINPGESINVNVNDPNKNGLKWFVQFLDDRYTGSGNQAWQSFELKNLIITELE